MMLLLHGRLLRLGVIVVLLLLRLYLLMVWMRLLVGNPLLIHGNLGLRLVCSWL